MMIPAETMAMVEAELRELRRTYAKDLREARAKEAMIGDERDELGNALAASEEKRAELATLVNELVSEVTGLRGRIERTDAMLAREDARPVAERVLELVHRLEPNARGALLEELARMHRQSSPKAGPR